jgi:hypothetical protein
MLKLNAVQWFYILKGLRDGHADLLQAMAWGPWTGRGETQIRAGIAETILIVRITSDQQGHETAVRVLERIKMIARRTGDQSPYIEHPLCQKIQQDMPLPKKWHFGLSPNQQGLLFFPALSPQPQLWEQLKRSRSVKQMRRATVEIYNWLLTAVPGVQNMPEFRIALCGRAEDLFRARKLWNYPSAGRLRPTSDNKRIEFFAKALAGLMLKVSPATATRKLANWKFPRLWMVVTPQLPKSA